MPPPGNPEARIAAKIEREERRRQAVKLAIDGTPYEEIAERLGYNSRQAAHKDVKAALAPASAALRAEADHFVAVQTARLEQMHRDARKIYEEFQRPADGDRYVEPVADQRLAAMDRMLRVGESLRKLVGADAPTKTESKTTLDATVGYSVAVSPEELEQL